MTDHNVPLSSLRGREGLHTHAFPGVHEYEASCPESLSSLDGGLGLSMHDHGDYALLDEALSVARWGIEMILDNQVALCHPDSLSNVLEFTMVDSTSEDNWLSVLIKTKQCNYHQLFDRLSSLHESLKDRGLRENGGEVSNLFILNHDAADDSVSISIVR